MNVDWRALAIGSVIFLAVAGGALLGLAFANVDVLAFVPWLAVVLAGVVTAIRALKSRIATAILLSGVIALLFGALNLAWSVAGLPADLPGFSGSVLVAGMSFIPALLLCVVSAFLVGRARRENDS